MKLVGATNWFVRGPFMIEGLLCGARRLGARGLLPRPRQGDRAAARSSPHLSRRRRRARARVPARRADPARHGPRPRRARLGPDDPPLPAGLTASDPRRRRGRPARQARRRRAVLHARRADRARPKGLGDLGRGDLAVVRTGRGRAHVEQRLGPATGSRTCSRRCSSSAARGSRSSRTTLRAIDVSRAASTCASCSTYTIDPDTAKDFDDALSFRREADGIRAWVHIADVSYFVGAGTPLDRGAARRALLDVRARRSSRRCCRTSSPTTSARCGRTRTGSASRSRCRRAASRSFYRSVIRSDARLTYGQARAARGAAGGPRALELNDELAPRAARGALRARRAAGADARGGVPLRRRRRRRRRVARGRAARAHARRGADDPRERARRRVPRVAAPRGALPRPRAARPAGGRAAAREARRPRRADAAGAGARSRRSRRPSSPARSRSASPRTSSSRAAAARRSRRSSCARSSRRATTRATSATPASRARRTATSPRRSAATPTSSSTARCCASSAWATIRCRTTCEALAEHTSAREREAAQLEYLADEICLAWLLERRLFERGWEERVGGRDHRPDRLGALRPLRRGVRGLPAGAPAARRVLRAERARRPRSRGRTTGRTLPARRPDRGARRVDRHERGQGRACSTRAR